MIKKILFSIVLVLIITGCATVSLSRADIDEASKIYFIPLNAVLMTAELSIMAPDTSDNIEISNPLLLPNEFKVLNKIYFEQMKSVFGEKILMIPDEFRTKIMVNGMEVDSWDFDNLDCDMYVKLEMEEPGSTRNITYSISDTDYNSESVDVVPPVSNIQLKICSVTPNEPAIELFYSNLIILGFHEEKGDFFHWSNSHIGDIGKLEKEFQNFAMLISLDMMDRAIAGADTFIMDIEDTLEMGE